MLFRELVGREIIDRNGERLGFVRDLVFTSTGRVTHIIAMPRGIVSKLTIGQINVQFEDIAAIEDVIMLNKTENQILGRDVMRPKHEAEPAHHEIARPVITNTRPKRILLKKKK